MEAAEEAGGCCELRARPQREERAERSSEAEILAETGETRMRRWWSLHLL